RGEGYPFRTWNQCLDLLRHLDFEFVLAAINVRPRRCARDGLDHLGMPIAEDVRPPRQCVIDVFVAVDVAHAAAATVGEVKRDRELRPERTAYASGQRVFGAG